MGKIGICIGCLLLFLCLPLSAQTVDELYEEQLEASGGEELLQELPTETRELLDRLGITALDPERLATQDIPTVLEELGALLVTVSAAPLRSCGLIFGIVMIQAWASGLNTAVSNDKNNTLFSIISALAACGVIMTPVAQCITKTASATESLSVFMMSFVPVYAGILLSAGHALSAFSFQSVVLYAAQLFSLLSHNTIVPLMGMALALGLVGAVTPGIRLSRFGEMIGKTATWLLTLSTLLFSGLLSLQNLAGNAIDTLGNRMVRFSIASFVPIVGGSLSEAFTTVRSCLSMLRSTIGVFGIAACAGIVLPPLLTCLIWSLGLSLCSTSADMFDLTAMSSLLKTAREVVKCLIGILCAGALFAVVAVTVVSLSASTA